MLPLEVTSDASVRECVAEVIRRAGRIDVLVNNAGYVLQGAVEETSLEEAKAQLDTNFFGVVRMVKVVLPAMRQAGRGHIITIGSLAGLTGIPFGAFYSAGKFALEGYSESLSHELRAFGIHVSLIEPGFVKTPISSAAHIAAGALAAYDAVRPRVFARLDRAVEAGIPPAEVANAVLAVADASAPPLRSRVGPDARLTPLLRQIMPWRLFASGLRRRFALDTL